MRLPKYLDPIRYADYIRRRRAIAAYDLPAVQSEERKNFIDAGLDATTGRERLDRVLLEISGRPFDHVTRSDSVHWLLFASLSLTSWGNDVRNILEIGTFRGKTTLLLSKLFPRARMVTIDLPETDPILVATYGRHDPAVLSDHQLRRNENIAAARAEFVAANSFFLPHVAPGPFDLIWVDGGHLYPEVAWDLCNAYSSCSSGGIIMCDDVYTHPQGGDGSYASYHAEEVIRYIAARTSVKVRYFLKRENPVWSALPRMRKYVVMIEKRASALPCYL